MSVIECLERNMLGSSANFLDYWGENQQHWCAQSNKRIAAEHYLAMNVHPKINHHGIHPLHCVAFSTGDINYAKWLLSISANASPIMPDILGRTPLHFASNRAHFDFTKYFITTDNIHMEDNHGRTLIIACCQGTLGQDAPKSRVALFKLLQSLGANPRHKDLEGHDAYYYAAHFYPYLLEHFDHQKEIIRGNPKDFFGANENTRRFLKGDFNQLPNKKERGSIRDALGFSALHMLCFSQPETNQSNQILIHLLEHLFISPDEQSMLEIMPAHIAASLGKSQFFEALLMRMPIVNYMDSHRRTFAIAACIPTGQQNAQINERIKIIHALEKRGCCFLYKDKDNKTALDYANINFPGSLLVSELHRITVTQTSEYLRDLKTTVLPKHFMPTFVNFSLTEGNETDLVEPTPKKARSRLSPLT